MTIWDKAPEIEVYKATALCADFGLHPLMRHIYLIKYNRYEGQGNQREKVGEDWTIQLGIGATRLIAHRQHRFGYKDDTPRRITKEEGEKILGDDYKPNTGVYAITRLIDMDTKAEVTGVGFFGNSEPDPKGMTKGNTRLNMACIRSERKAIDRQYPAEMPTGYEVYDERYADTPSGKVDTTSGEVLPDGVVEGEIVKTTTSSTEFPPVVVEEELEPIWPEETESSQEKPPPEDVGIDMPWLRESLKTLKRSEKAIATWAAEKYRVQGGLLKDVIALLTLEQKQSLTKEIEDRLEIVKNNG